MHYIMGAMAKLPKVEGVCYRGYPDKAVVLAQYKPVRKTPFLSDIYIYINDFLPRQARDKHRKS